MSVLTARKAPSEMKATEFTLPSAGITMVSRRWRISHSSTWLPAGTASVSPSGPIAGSPLNVAPRGQPGPSAPAACCPPPRPARSSRRRPPGKCRPGWPIPRSPATGTGRGPDPAGGLAAGPDDGSCASANRQQPGRAEEGDAAQGPAAGLDQRAERRSGRGVAQLHGGPRTVASRAVRAVDRLADRGTGSWRSSWNRRATRSPGLGATCDHLIAVRVNAGLRPGQAVAAGCSGAVRGDGSRIPQQGTSSPADATREPEGFQATMYWVNRSGQHLLQLGRRRCPGQR